MKKLKLKKKVKVITTLLSFGMLLTVLPSMKLVAEDDTIDNSSNDDVVVAPYLNYQNADTGSSDEVLNENLFTTYESNDNSFIVEENNTSGGLKYDNDTVTVDKTIEKQSVGTNDNIYKLTMSASSGKWMEYNAGVDYILMVDVSKNMNATSSVDRLKNVKDALKLFIKNVYERSPESRVAIVKYGNEATVLTNNNEANKSALIGVTTLNSNGVTESSNNKLTEIVNQISLPNGNNANSQSDLAMLDAVKIFQSVDSDLEDPVDKYGNSYKDRTRVSILFTAGFPGKGKIADNSDNSEDWTDYKNYHKDATYSEYTNTGWTFSARNVAQATMSLSTILKGHHLDTITPPSTSNVANGKQWSGLEKDYSLNINNYYGCGSTLYTVGLNIDSATNPSEIKSINDLRNFGDLTYNRNGYALSDLKANSRQAALINEFLYRVSSHRKTGEHFTYNDDGLEDWFKAYYDSLNNCSIEGWTIDLRQPYSKDNQALYYFYPDCITRDLQKTLNINGKEYATNGSYFLTATDDNINKLSTIFSKIAQQVGEVMNDLSVRDYLDPSFVPVDSAGKQLSDGSEIMSDKTTGYKGIVHYDQANKLWYIEWSNVILSPKVGEQDAKTFKESIYVKPVDDLVCGNNLTTNMSSSGVYSGDKIKYAFPQPTVDIPVRYDYTVNSQNIYITNSFDLNSMISGTKPNGVNNKNYDMVFTFKNSNAEEIGTYTISAGQSFENGAWSSLNNFNYLTEDDTITVDCMITLNSEHDDSQVSDSTHHACDKVAKESKITGKNAQVNVFKPELIYHDLHIYYGDSKPDYSSALSNASWKHGDTLANDVTMNGSAPGLNLSYDDVNSGTVGTKFDYQVGVTVKIGDRGITEFSKILHTECNDKSDKEETLEPNKNFIVHVNTCSLTITKKGGTSGETYFFTIKKKEKTDDSKEDYIDYTKVSITVGSDNNQVVIKELPVGDYQITEDDDTSWRYESKFDESSSAEVSLNKNNSSASVTCKNTKNNDKWLNKISSVAKNVYTKITTNE